MRNKEIERRFLLKDISVDRWLRRAGIVYEKVDIEQFYLKSSLDGVDRYRKAGDKYFHTIKSGAGLIRDEREFPISEARYKIKKRKNRGGVIYKTRYKFKIGEYLYELDSFKEELKGLSILEIEFTDVKKACKFKVSSKLKPILIQEITGIRAFSNGAISKTMKIPSLDI